MYYFVSLVVSHKPIALLSHPCRLPVAFLSPSCRKEKPCRSPVALLSLSCRSPVAFSCRFPVASLSPLALFPSRRLPFAFLSLILSLCLVSCRFPVVSLSPPCRRAVALLSPSCRSSPVAFLSPACHFLSLSCRFPAAFLSSSCRHPVVFLSPPCRLPVAPCRISPSPASRGPNLISGGPCCVLSYIHTFWSLRRQPRTFVGPLRVQAYLLLLLCPWVCGMCVLWRWCALRWRVVPFFRLLVGVPHTMPLSVRAA